VVLDPENPNAWISLGRLLLAGEQFADAADALAQAATLAPDEPQVWAELGVARLMRRDLGSAEEALRTALGLDPDHAGARHQLALVYLTLGERQAAVTELERVARADPDAALDLAVVLIAEGEHERALQLLQSDAPRARFYRALALDQLGRGEEALALLEPLADEIYTPYAAQARAYLKERGEARG
jgi:cytochrome c-type biogenesis protein CcmH/NrfG